MENKEGTVNRSKEGGETRIRWEKRCIADVTREERGERNKGEEHGRRS